MALRCLAFGAALRACLWCLKMLPLYAARFWMRAGWDTVVRLCLWPIYPFPRCKEEEVTLHELYTPSSYSLFLSLSNTNTHTCTKTKDLFTSTTSVIWLYIVEVSGSQLVLLLDANIRHQKANQSRNCLLFESLLKDLRICPCQHQFTSIYFRVWLNAQPFNK